MSSITLLSLENFPVFENFFLDIFFLNVYPKRPNSQYLLRFTGFLNDVWSKFASGLMPSLRKVVTYVNKII